MYKSTCVEAGLPNSHQFPKQGNNSHPYVNLSSAPPMGRHQQLSPPNSREKICKQVHAGTDKEKEKNIKKQDENLEYRDFKTPYSSIADRIAHRKLPQNHKNKTIKHRRTPYALAEPAEIEEALESLVGTDSSSPPRSPLASSSKTGTSSFLSNLLTSMSSRWPLELERRRALKGLYSTMSSNSPPSGPLGYLLACPIGGGGWMRLDTNCPSHRHFS
jgi:hypothetical protein